jgi:hypothetical protein
VSGLLLRGAGPCNAAIETLAPRTAYFPDIQAVQGQDWIAFIPSVRRESRQTERGLTLPRVADALALYHRQTGVWLPVGWEAGVPAHAEAPLLRAMLSLHSIETEVVVVPRSSGDALSAAAEIFVLDERRTLSELRASDLVDQIPS